VLSRLPLLYPVSGLVAGKSLFERLAERAAKAAGSKYAFAAALMVIIIWGVTGPFFRYSDTWQLVINTGTTIVTFLMVFLLQNSTNREGRAVQIKLDELILKDEKAENKVIALESKTETEIEEIAEVIKGEANAASSTVSSK
jgi:low affinity Fe/Cu permease